MVAMWLMNMELLGRIYMADQTRRTYIHMICYNVPYYLNACSYSIYYITLTADQTRRQISYHMKCIVYTYIYIYIIYIIYTHYDV